MAELAWPLASEDDTDIEVITTLAGLQEVLDEIGDGAAALDFETTGLDPTCCEVRLVSLVNDDLAVLVDFAQIKGGFNAHARLFDRGAWIVFNAGFEQSWFLHACPDVPITCWDVGHLKRAIDGGGHMSLASMALIDLDVAMDKTQQVSNWADPNLTRTQLAYALDDGIITWSLWKMWTAKADRQQMDCFNMLNDLVLPCEDMQRHGMLLDCERHAELVAHWEMVQEAEEIRVRQYISVDDVDNLGSGKQKSGFFSKILPDEILDAWPRTDKTGELKTDRDSYQMIAGLMAGTPLAEALYALIDHATISKYLSSFGEGLIGKAQRAPDGRIHARYNIGAARTCRFSCSSPNLQQVPRDRELLGEETSIRRSFIAPPGRELVSLDYSGIELRMLALLSGDDQLLHDCIEGDVHLEVGSYWAGRRLDKSVLEDYRTRQAAKGVSFLIIYGGMVPGLASVMRTDYDTAADLMTFWEERYTNAFRYRHVMQEQAKETGYIRCVDGGTIWLGQKPALPKCANYPVQRAALSIMARAIYYHWEDLRARSPRTWLLSTIHDALIDEADEGQAAEDAYDMMAQAMEDAYLDFFPGAPTAKLVEGGIGPSWGELEEV